MVPPYPTTDAGQSVPSRNHRRLVSHVALSRAENDEKQNTVANVSDIKNQFFAKYGVWPMKKKGQFSEREHLCKFVCVCVCVFTRARVCEGDCVISESVVSDENANMMPQNDV